MRFKVGYLVVHITKVTQVMRVKDINQVEKKYLCEWTDKKGKLQEEWFDEDALALASDYGPMGFSIG